MGRKKGTKDYAPELKLKAIHMHLDEGKSYAEITQELGIRDPKRVRAWMVQYRRDGETAFDKAKRGRPPKKDSLEAYIQQLEMENTLLKALRIELGEDLPDGLDTE